MTTTLESYFTKLENKSTEPLWDSTSGIRKAYTIMKPGRHTWLPSIYLTLFDVVLQSKTTSVCVAFNDKRGSTIDLPQVD